MNKTVLNRFPYFKLSPSQVYNQSTKITKLYKENKLVKKNPPVEWVEVNYKGYPRFPKIPLSNFSLTKTVSLYDALFKRRSFRTFTNQKVSLEELSELLYRSAGIRLKNSTEIGNRPYPSAGARYPLEIYPLILNVKNLEKGIYHYHLRSHSLEYLWTFQSIKKKILSNFNQTWIKNSAVIFVITAVFWRMEVKYGDRGYRNSLMEAGMLTQNIYLTTLGMNLGCCSIGGYIDDKLNKLLDIDGDEESIVTCIALGHV